MNNRKKCRKKFSLASCVLTIICVIFVAEAAAPVASIGNSQYFWWLFMFAGFLLPYGMISAELGTAFDRGGGLYDWVSAAYGHGAAGRAAWCYWIEFPLWTASLAIIFPEIFRIITGIRPGTVWAVLMELAFIWIVFFISCRPVSEAVWILNGSAVIKMLLAAGIGVFGLLGAAKNGMANPVTVRSLLPSFDPASLSFISVIIFNMLGFEVICTMSGDMKDPDKEIPRAIAAGGVVIALLYMFSAFGIGAAIPTSEISTSTGLIDAFILLTGKSRGPLISAAAGLFGLTLFGNMISWSTGVHEVAAYAAERGDLPSVFARRSRKNQRPVGGILMTALVASAVVVIAPLIPNPDTFWSFFALNLVMFLMAYIPMFPAFLKLRREQPDAQRPFRVPLKGPLLALFAWVPMLLIIVSILFTAVPLSADPEILAGTLPITVGAVLCLGLGEVVIRLPRRERT